MIFMLLYLDKTQIQETKKPPYFLPEMTPAKSFFLSSFFPLYCLPSSLKANRHTTIRSDYILISQMLYFLFGFTYVFSQ